MTSMLPPLVQAFSGAFGSAAANASSYPLDLVCTRLQTSESRERQGIASAIDTLKRIIRKRGTIGLYDGLETDTAATLISNFFYYYTYSFLRNRIFRRNSAKASATLAAFEEIAVGFLAGVASHAVSTPLSLITVRLQSEWQLNAEGEKEETNVDEPDADSSGSIANVIRHIYRENGLRGFWRGFETTTLLCLNPSLTLFLFQAFRRVFLRGRDRKQPSPHQAFIGTAVLNVIAVTVLYPFILAKTRLQSACKSSSTQTDRSQRPESMLDIWCSAYHRDGFTGLYQGLEAQLIKGFLSQGLTMMMKQRLEHVIIALYLYHVRSSKKIVL